MSEETNKTDGELVNEYIKLQHSINVTGEFCGRHVKNEQLIREELTKRGFLIDLDGRIKNLEDFDFSS